MDCYIGNEGEGPIKKGKREGLILKNVDGKKKKGKYTRKKFTL